MNRCCVNIIYASDSTDAYLFEAELWFGKEIAVKTYRFIA